MSAYRINSRCVQQKASERQKTPKNPPVAGSSLIAKGKEFLESQVCLFPPGASAIILPQSSRLIVRNTADNLELVDALVNKPHCRAQTGRDRVKVLSRITQNT